MPHRANSRASARVTSQERRAARAERARRALRAFLDSLDPARRLYVLGRLSDARLQTDWLSASADRNKEYASALIQYYELASRFPNEWKQVLKRVSPAHADLLELKYRGKTKGPGAPVVPLDEREDVLTARAVADAETTLRPAFRVCQEQRRGGGYQSDPDLITEELRKRGCGANQVKAVLTSKTLTGAAQAYVALKTGKSEATVRAMASRGRRLQE